MELFRKSELILESVSVVITTNVDDGLVLVEMNNVDVDIDENITVLEDGITASLDYEDLDEIILVLQQASETLKRKEQQYNERG
ncbi:hypothetical protein [Ureibacillus sp. FSL E2-3493]|uniref:hypothetical protein n=1 Tax=Ureibacillus sp. FSL E2-3493 TaxID=2921367 RepID=UPI00311A736A